MDVDTDNPPFIDQVSPPETDNLSAGQDVSVDVSQSTVGTIIPVDASTATPAVSRTFRARPSLPDTAVTTSPSASLTPKAPTSHIRAPTATELSRIHRRLGPQAIQARRDELLAEKEKELREVVDGHDTAVREKFHLERFVTMITGWNPEVS